MLKSPISTKLEKTPALNFSNYRTVNYLRWQYNVHTKHLHLVACKCCIRGAAGALRVQPL